MTCSSTPRVHDAGRRALAWWAAVLWVVGFELMPDAHLGLHGQLGAHSHAGVVVAHDDHEHEHEHEHHHHHDDAGHHDHGFEPIARPGRALETSADVVGDHAIVRGPDLDHGQHDLLHRGIAVVQPPD